MQSWIRSDSASARCVQVKCRALPPFPTTRIPAYLCPNAEVRARRDLNCPGKCFCNILTLRAPQPLNQSQRVLSAMIDELIMDVTLQSHHEVARSKVICPECKTQYVFPHRFLQMEHSVNSVTMKRLAQLRIWCVHWNFIYRASLFLSIKQSTSSCTRFCLQYQYGPRVGIQRQQDNCALPPGNTLFSGQQRVVCHARCDWDDHAYR